MVKCTSSKGIDMVELILKVFNSLKLDPKKCVGNATDGAANMQGEYRGFSAQLSNVANKQIHIWCYAHVLNLVIGDVTNKILQSINLFGILNGCAVFIKESHKRMDVWTNKEKNKRICSIGETRWWSKHSALSKVFGNFKRPEPGLFVELLTTLIEIKNDVSITADARYKAIGLIEGLCKYETILTAQIYLRIFQKTTPLSKYLQGHGINMMTSFQMVQATLEELKLDVRDFASVKEAADNFVTWANNKLEVEECEVEVSHSFPETRKKKEQGNFPMNQLMIQ
ncbi:zinc finger MYM-type protein 1-like [Aphis craccivora]|uniref:Zinc finger MYM-type protein 1-like n=1 Tax=Aphis craccivora TaxID=307492 RepID=A0A6G0VGV0_APHCR|nr:zinc finger MYM-type protein 1-like [Aphis craccivora]